MSDSQDTPVDEYGASFLTQSETLQGTWEYDDHEFKLEVEDISMGAFKTLQEYMKVGVMASQVEEDDEDAISELEDSAENLEDLPWESETDAEGFIESTIEAKLHKPNVDVSAARAPKMQAVFKGMMDAWQEGNTS